METLERGVKYVQRHQNVVLVSLLLNLNIFHTCSGVSIVNFEQEIVAGRRVLTKNQCA